MNTTLINHINRLKAIADTGLLYANNEYDIERYKELESMSMELLTQVSGMETQQLQSLFSPVKDYPTAKVDIRALIISADNKILLVQEQIDQKWSLPGGWADIGFSPKETVIKECKEETGLDVEVKRLLAVFDKRMHNHPPQNTYVYKMVFYCTAQSNDLNTGFDVLDAQYFNIHELPPLSEDRIIKSQIELVYNKVVNEDVAVYFD